jgi:hypothetical protein
MLCSETNSVKTFLKRLNILALLIVIVFSGFNSLLGQGQLKDCKLLRNSDTAYSGYCKITDTTQIILKLKPPTKNEKNIWRGQGAFPGTKTEIPVFIEVRSDSGTIGSLNGWYEISKIQSNDRTLEFVINLSQRTPATNKDLEILQRARAYLSDTTKWSRQDNRTFGYIDCQPQSTQRTLFCAIYYAALEVLGDNYGGLYFIEVVQAIKRLRNAQHPVQAFNNDPSTTLTDVQKVLDDVINQIKQKLSSQKNN